VWYGYAQGRPAQETAQPAQGQAGRDVLLYAARFPALLLIAFGLIVLWFRSRGGYKPVELQEHSKS
jgi:hypothetical protein